jgi:long-chain acyl-CoA synthetase
MRTFAQLIREHARLRPEAAALTFENKTWSFSQLHERSSRVGNALSAAGVHAGDRVAVLAKNRAEFFELILACSKIGAILVGLNWRLASQELTAIVKDAQPAVLLVAADEQKLLSEEALQLPCLKQLITFGSVYEEWLETASTIDSGYNGAPDEVVLILYTSGTTGQPKGVMLTNEGMSYTRRLASESWGMGPDSVNLVAMPMFHIGGCGYGSSTFCVGGHTILMREVNPSLAVDLIVKHRVTHAFFVPTVVQSLLSVPAIAEADLSSLELLMYGASPIGDVLLRKALSVLKCNFMQAYGMTEASGTVVVLEPADHDPDGPKAGLLRSCGRAMPWVDLRIVEPGSKEPVKTGEVGEIWLRSPMLMKGYWNQPQASAEAFVDGEWFRTGDAAYQDEEGYLYLFDRFKDMIISGGENIYPAEVENVLNGHPAIQEVGVIGIAHQRWGETPLAVVVLRKGYVATAQELIDFARERLAHYKCPTAVKFVSALPRNASGKLLKREMRREFLNADGQYAI